MRVVYYPITTDWRRPYRQHPYLIFWELAYQKTAAGDRLQANLYLEVREQILPTMAKANYGLEHRRDIRIARINIICLLHRRQVLLEHRQTFHHINL